MPGTPYPEGTPSSGRISGAAPTSRSVDAKTLTRKMNEGLQRQPGYEFGGGRVRKYQRRDYLNEP